MSTIPLALQTLLIGGVKIDLSNVQLSDALQLDEVHLEGGDIRVDLPRKEGETERVTTGDVSFRLAMSEPNLNRFLEASLPTDVPVRTLRIALYSGRARISGQYVKLIALPFTLDAVPRVENGIRVTLDCQGATAGIGLPAAIVKVIDQLINEYLQIDLSRLPIPIWLNELRCEPGRLSAIGRARGIWPPDAAVQAVAPFTPREVSTRETSTLPPPAPALESPSGTEEVPGDAAPSLPS
jgi:hypothetical protein